MIEQGAVCFETAAGQSPVTKGMRRPPSAGLWEGEINFPVKGQPYSVFPRVASFLLLSLVLIAFLIFWQAVCWVGG